MQDFINKVKNGAMDGQKTHGILASVSIAQAILESNWGRSVLATQANNLFGIKASPDWQGQTFNRSSLEFVNGKMIDQISTFRKYENWNESIKDHAKFFTSTEWRKERYKKVLSASDYKVASMELGKSGYATDPGYGNKILNLIETYKLYQYDKGDDTMSNRNGITICLDAGHGGGDPGAVGFGLKEKDVALNVVLKLGQLLIARGFNVVYTRTTDTFIPLPQIANIANIAKADFFVSTHCNAAANPNAYGFETFHYPGASGGNKMAGLVQQSIQDNTKLYQAGKPTVNRGVKSAYFTVLTNTAMEAILVEMAFISNREDNNILKTQQDGFAEALCNAICKYYNVATEPVEEPLPPVVDTPKAEEHWGYRHVVELNKWFADSQESLNIPWDDRVGISELRLDDNISRAEAFRMFNDIIRIVEQKAKAGLYK